METITRVPMGKSNSYLIKSNDGFILVDAGMPQKSKNIFSALNNYNARFDDINLIVVTHVHYDHVGSLYEIKNKSNAPVLVHSEEKNVLNKGYNTFPEGTLFFSKIISKLANTFSSSKEQFRPVNADIVIKDNFELSNYGVDGEIIHTPGHTEGSICVIVESKNCITGDTLFNFFPNSVYPPFANDEKKLLESWKRIREYGCEKYFPGHGNEFTLKKFNKTLRKHSEK